MLSRVLMFSVKRWPAWAPGGEFLRLAKDWRGKVDKFKMLPFAAAIRLMVSIMTR